MDKKPSLFVFWFAGSLFGLLIIFLIRIPADTKSVQGMEASPEERIVALETRVAGLEQEIARVDRRYQATDSQFRHWISGHYQILLHGTNEYQTYLLGTEPFEDPGATHESVYSRYIGDELVIVMEVEGSIVDQVDLTDMMQPGDVVVAWRDDGQYMERGEPWPSSPDFWSIYPYYWNSETQLAVGILRVTGGFEVGGIVR